MLKILVNHQENISSKLKYLIPIQWQKFLQLRQQYFLNENINQSQIKQFLNHNKNDFINKIVPFYQESIQLSQNQVQEKAIKQIQQKTNYLEIDHLTLNHKPKINTLWKPVSQQIYKKIKQNTNFQINLPLFYLQNPQFQFIQIDQSLQFKLVKVLFCSNQQSRYFYGYINSQIQDFIEKFIKNQQYQVDQSTKLTFLQANNNFCQKIFNCNLSKYQNGQILMIHGLKKLKQIQVTQNQIDFLKMNDLQYQFSIISFSSKKNNIPNNFQRNFDQITMAYLQTRTLSQRTMSTGAQTPLIFPHQDQDMNLLRQYKNYGLFGQNLAQQIQSMKQYAKQAIYGELINVSFIKTNTSYKQLQKIAQLIQENIEKRKYYQKQNLKQQKQFLKEQLCSQDSISSKQSKEITSTKTIQSQRKIKQVKSKVYFTQGNQNF